MTLPPGDMDPNKSLINMEQAIRTIARIPTLPPEHPADLNGSAAAVKEFPRFIEAHTFNPHSLNDEARKGQEGGLYNMIYSLASLAGQGTAKPKPPFVDALGELVGQEFYDAQGPQTPTAGPSQPSDDAISTALVWAGMADSFKNRAQRLGTLSDIEIAIYYSNQAIPLVPDSHEFKPLMLNSLGSAYILRFLHLGNLDDINNAVHLHTLAVQLTPSGRLDIPYHLANLGNSLRTRFERLGDLKDLENAVAHQTKAVLLTPDGDPRKARRMSDLGCSYYCRFERLGDLDDLENCISYNSQAIRLISDEDHEKSCCLSNLGGAHHSRFQRLSDPKSLEAAIYYCSQAVSLTPEGHPEKPGRLNNLGRSYLSRFEEYEDMADLDAALVHIRQAVLLTSEADPRKSHWIMNLAQTHRARFNRLRELADLDDAIKCMNHAISLNPEGHPDKSRYLASLSGLHNIRFSHSGSLADLDCAIAYSSQAVLNAPERHPETPGWYMCLGNSYSERFGRFGNLADLDNAIDSHSQALFLTPEKHPERLIIISNLGISYHERFEHLGDLADLDLAIHHNKQATLLCPPGDSSKPAYLNNLGLSLRNRYERLRDVNALDGAIDCYREAISLLTEHAPNKPLYLNNLGNSLRSRFECTGDHLALDLSIETHTRAVLFTDEKNPKMPAHLNNLGTSYMRRFLNAGDQSDLDDAMVCHHRALLLTPEGHPQQLGMLFNLGNLYLTRFGRLNEGDSLNKAIAHYRDAALSSIAKPSICLLAARQWAKASFLTPHESPLPAYKRAIELIPQVVWLGGTVDQRYQNIITVGDIISDAAVAAIKSQAYDLALEWMEEGSSIVWKQILQLRTPLDELRAVNSELAQVLEETARQLDEASTRAATNSSTSTDSLESAAQSHHRVAELYERLISQVRDLPGFSDFMRPKKASALIPAARHSTVVVINVHETRCDALVLLPNSDAITLIPLPNLSHEVISAARRQLTQFIHNSMVKRRGVQRSASANPDMMNMLWQCISKPVLDHLGYLTLSPGEKLPHITWCTSGPLAFLPLHAAGSYNEPGARVFNYAISSYTPTLSALLVSHPDPDTFRGILAVGQANTPDLPPLPGTNAELAQVEQRAGSLRVEKMTEDRASVTAVMRGMEEHSWIHMACHASQNRADPTRSAFHLHNGALDLATIMQKSLKGKGLAFLSACETATGDNDLPGEAVHLAAGMLMAGYPSVIATMWSIQDEDAPLIAERVYAQLLGGGVADTRKAAEALHNAVGCLREKVGEKNFARWVPYIHIGL